MDGLAHLPWREVEVRKDKAGDRWADMIDRMAAGFEKPVADAFKAAAKTLADRASVAALAEAIKQGNVDAVISILGLAPDGASFAGVLPPLQQAAAVAGQASIATAAAGGVAGATNATLSFDLFNPHTSAFLRDYGFRLIQQISQEVREGIAEAVRAGVEAGQGPAVTARAVKQVAGFGLTKQQARALHNYRRELESLDANALERALRDKRFDKTIQAAIKGAKGKALTKEQIDKMVARYAERLLAHRAMVIARTESLRAANMGAHLAMRQAVENGSIPEAAIVRRWVVAKDERVCPSCRQIPKLNPKGVGLREPFNTPLGAKLLPPAHPLCRCAIVHRIRPVFLGEMQPKAA